MITDSRGETRDKSRRYLVGRCAAQAVVTGQKR